MNSTQPEIYRYRLKSTGYSSARYGPCGVCREHCTEVFIQVEERRHVHWADRGSVCEPGWTQHQCNTLFGHESCLKSKQQNPVTLP